MASRKDFPIQGASKIRELEFGVPPGMMRVGPKLGQFVLIDNCFRPFAADLLFALGAVNDRTGPLPRTPGYARVLALVQVNTKATVPMNRLIGLLLCT